MMKGGREEFSWPICDWQVFAMGVRQSASVGLKRSKAKLFHKPYDMHFIGIRRGNTEISADIIQKMPRVKLIRAQRWRRIFLPRIE
jgi:hypothetical protein